MVENKRVKNRRDTAANWTANNPVLLAGEFGIELDSTPIKMKIGDGTTHWNDLPYAGASESEIIGIIEETTYTKQQIDTALDGKADADDVYTKTEVDNIKSQIEGEIPTVNDSTVNIYQGGTLKGSFTLNQSSGETINLDAGGVSSVGWDNITDKPDFASVAISGEYSDLNHKPQIPVKTSDLTNDSGFVTSSDLARVASTGEYTDLLHRPEIPTVGDGTITIKQGNVTKGTFTTNQSGDTTIIIDEGGQFTQQQSNWLETDTTTPSYIQNKPTIPTATSDLTNDSGFITLNDVPTQVNADWNSNSGASQILNKPTIPTKTSDLQNDSGFTTFSGDYNDLSNKPQIPSNTSDLTNDSGFITSADVPAQAQADWTEADPASPSYIQHKPSIPSGQQQSDWNQSDSTQVDFIKNKPTIPTKTSDLTNDSGFITSADVPAQAQADWNEADSTDPSYIQNKPTVYTEWFGTQAQYDAIVVKDQNTIYHIEGPAPVQSNWNESDSTSLAYIQNKPTIPTATSDLTNDSGFVTSSDVPTATSDLTNDSGFITLSDVPAQVNADWNSNSGASQILNKPNIPVVNDSTINIYQGGTLKGSFTLNQASGETINLDAGGVSSVGWDDITGKPDFATVATSGEYSDLNHRPQIPVKTSDLTNDSGFITSSDIPAQQNADWNSNSGVSQILNKPNITTETWTFTVDDGQGGTTTVTKTICLV